MDSQLEKTYGRFGLYMVIAVKCIMGGNTEIPTMEEWIGKIMEFAEMIKYLFD